MVDRQVTRREVLAALPLIGFVFLLGGGSGGSAGSAGSESDPVAIRSSAANQVVQSYAPQLDLVSPIGSIAVSDGGQVVNPNNGLLENQIDLEVSPSGGNPVKVSAAHYSGGIQASIGAIDHVHPLLLDTKNKSLSYTMTDSDCVIRATAGGITITLPAASAGLIGMIAIVMKVDAGVGAVTVAPNGSNTILGGSITLAAQGSETMLRCATASSWEKISSL